MVWRRWVLAVWAIGLLSGFAPAAIAGPEDDLFSAAARGDAASVQALLSKGVNVNAKDKDGSTALIEAAGLGHVDVVRALLANGADVNAKDDEDSTALIHAAHAINGPSGGAYLDIVQVLLAKGANVNARDDRGFTPLMMASRQNHIEIVRALLAIGADVNAKSSAGTTALEEAAVMGNVEVLETLIAKGADVSARDKSGRTALANAARFGGSSDAVRVLLAKGAEVKARAIVSYQPPATMRPWEGGYRWDASFKETGGQSGFSVSATDFYLIDKNNHRWTGWSKSVDVKPNGSADVEYWFDPFSTNFSGGKFHCVWVGGDDAGNSIRIEQDTYIP